MKKKRTSTPGLGRRGLVLLVLALAALAAFIVLSRRDRTSTPPELEPLLSSIPAGAILVVELDLAALRSHPLGKELLGQGREIAGLGQISDVCQRDPLAQIDRIALAVPELEGVGFGLFARGSFGEAELLACAGEIVRRRGGRPESTPGPLYTVMRDGSLGPGSAELAARAGALVLAEPPYMRQALAASEGQDEIHRELRGLVPPGLVVATAVLSEAQRRTLLDELRAQGDPDSPLGALRDGALSLRLGETLVAEAVVRCLTAEACRDVATQLSARRDDLAGQPTYRMLGLSDLLRTVTIRAEGDRVLVHAAAKVEDLLALLERLRVLEQLMQPEAPPRPTATVSPGDGERIAPAKKTQ